MSEVLLKVLRSLSPTMNQLVDKAIQEGIQIITVQKYVKICSKHWPDYSPAGDKKTELGAAHFPEIGLAKTIIVSPSYICKCMGAGCLGLLEINFAHEIGHILTLVIEKPPTCAYDLSYGWPVCRCCAYCELMADWFGLKLLAQIHKNLKTHCLLFRKKKITISQLFSHPNVSHPDYLDKMNTCPGLLEARNFLCPKARKIKALVKKIEHLLK